MHRKNRANAPKKAPTTSPKLKIKQKARQKALKRPSQAPTRPLGTSKLKSNRKGPAKSTNKRPLPCKKRAKTVAPKPPISLRDEQRKWYAILKASGFQDLERLSNTEGLDGLLSSRGSQPIANLKHAALQSRDVYYRRLTNFVTHNPNWSGNRLYNLIASLYVDGVSYRNMLPRLQASGFKTNIWRISKVVESLEAKSGDWNKRHPEGLDFEPDLTPDSRILARAHWK